MKHRLNLVYFIRQSMHKKLALKPYGSIKSVIKSMLQEVNLNVGIGNGCSRSVGKDVEPLVFLHTSHVEMNLLTESCSFGYQIRANK